MSYKDLVDLDEGAEMIDLGVASLETEGDTPLSSENGQEGSQSPEAH